MVNFKTQRVKRFSAAIRDANSGRDRPPAAIQATRNARQKINEMLNDIVSREKILIYAILNQNIVIFNIESISPIPRRNYSRLELEEFTKRYNHDIIL